MGIELYNEQQLKYGIQEAKRNGLVYIRPLPAPLPTTTYDKNISCYLHGIGIIYDEDRDERILAAVNEVLWEIPGVVAVYERKARLTVFANDFWLEPDHVNSLSDRLAGKVNDEWEIQWVSWCPKTSEWKGSLEGL